MPWKILKSKVTFKNKFFKIREDKCKKKDGKIVDAYYTIERPAAAIIAAFTEDRELILVNQYRHPVKSVDFELPAGFLEPHERNTAQAAARELLEETGYKAKKFKKLQKTFASAGLMNYKTHFFIAFGAKKIGKQKLDDNEEILEVITVPFKKALTLLSQEKIKDMASVTGLLLAKEYLEKL